MGKSEELKPALAGLLVSLGSALLGPVSYLKENRVQEGTPWTFSRFLGGLDAAPLPVALIFALIGLQLLMLVAVLAPRGGGTARSKLGAEAVLGAMTVLSFSLSLLTLAEAGRRALLLGPAAAAQGSWGFWLPFAAAALTLDHSRRSGGRLALAVVAAGFLPGLLAAALIGLDGTGFMRELSLRQDRFRLEALRHLRLTILPVAAAAALGVPLGIAAYRRPALGRLVFPVAGGLQTIPSLALFGLLIAPLSALSRSIPLLRQAGLRGIGWAPAFIALTLYALLPILRNTTEGYLRVDRGALDAGRGMGMGPWALFWQVESPLALPLVLRGLRVATVQTAGTATVAALVGGGGFGVFVFQGIGQAAPALVILGALPVLLFAVSADRFWGILEQRLVPRGLRSEKSG